MSAGQKTADTENAEVLICDYCGGVIEHRGQRCLALDEGGCVP